MAPPGSGARLGRILASGTSMNTPPHSPMGWRRFDSFALVILLDGGGRYQDEDGFDLALGAGDVWIVRPGVRHQYGPGPDNLWHERWLVFDGPVFELWSASGLFDWDTPIIRTGEPGIWSERFDGVLGKPDVPGTDALEQVCRLQELLARLLRRQQLGPDLSTSDEEWLSRAMSLLDRADAGEVGVMAVSDRMALSYDGFRKKFRRPTGVPPGRYVALARIERSKQLIQERNLTNREVADALGFYDEHHFSRSFKGAVGMSTREFRRRLPAAASPRLGEP